MTGPSNHRIPRDETRNASRRAERGTATIRIHSSLDPSLLLKLTPNEVRVISVGSSPRIEHLELP